MLELNCKLEERAAESQRASKRTIENSQFIRRIMRLWGRRWDARGSDRVTYRTCYHGRGHMGRPKRLISDQAHPSGSLDAMEGTTVRGYSGSEKEERRVADSAEESGCGLMR